MSLLCLSPCVLTLFSSPSHSVRCGMPFCIELPSFLLFFFSLQTGACEYWSLLRPLALVLPTCSAAGARNENPLSVVGQLDLAVELAPGSSFLHPCLSLRRPVPSPVELGASDCSRLFRSDLVPVSSSVCSRSAMRATGRMARIVQTQSNAGARTV